MTLRTIPCSKLKGIGTKTSEYFARLDIHNIFDLLLHLPLRYEDRTKITALSDLKPNQIYFIEGTIREIRSSHYGRGRSSCIIEDETGELSLSFFHFNKTLKYVLKPGVQIRCFGEVLLRKRGFEMVHPDYQIVREKEYLTDHLTPVYPATEGLHQSTIRKAIDQAIDLLDQHQIDFLPHLILKRINAHFKKSSLYRTFSELLKNIHRPSSLEEVENIKNRLILEELIAQQLKLSRVRKSIKSYMANAFKNKDSLLQQFLDQLPFQLTTGQQEAIGDIQKDLAKSYPMLRLLQGDVGSGKTLVAMAAALIVASSEKQVAIMVPTELLAKQHIQTFRQYLEPLGIHIELLTSQIPRTKKNLILEKIASGTSKIIIGTHAIFQHKVHFFDLSLLIIDEQHRFGIHQKLSLKQKGIKQGFKPHQLIMTATPIPRSLAMTAYNHLDCSIISVLPSNRQPVTTAVLPNHKRPEVIKQIRKLIQKGQQIYWVCALIDPSDQLTCAAAVEVEKELKQQLPDLHIALLHGQMDGVEKEHIMVDFQTGKYDLLVSTTVIEVGIDVPNATLIVIENAERLGLAQLHQLRGRVGRGHQKGYCILLYKNPLTEWAKERLQTIRNHHDGFKIAQKDLEMRGPGEILGTKQTGQLKMRIANLARDAKYIDHANKLSQEILKKHPEIIVPLIHRWIDQKPTEHDGQV